MVAALATGCVDSLSDPDAGGVVTRPDVSGLDDVAAVDTVSPDSLLPDTAGAPDVSFVDLGPFEWNPDDETLPLFEQGVVKALEVTMPADQLQGLLSCWKDPPEAVLEGTAKCWFTCTATFEGKQSAPASCRPKGRPEKWADQKKPQWIVRFDQTDKTGRFYGLRRFNLESNTEVLAPVRDRLGMWFMREAGVPAPRVSLVTMTVNGSDYGPYQLIEPVDKEFLQDHFANPEGNLYDDEGELTTNETTSTRARLELLYDKIETEHGKLDQSHTTFFAGFGGLADVDAFMRFMAAEIALATTDNFTDGAGNTYLYDQSPGPGLLPIPWDHDELFDITVADPTEALGTCISSAGFADEPQPFCELFWSDAGMRAALADELRRLRDGPMQQLPAELKRYCDEARPYVVADPFAGDEIATRFEADCAQIGDFIDTRIDFLENAAELK